MYAQRMYDDSATEETPIVPDKSKTLTVTPEQSVYGGIMFLPAISRLTEPAGHEWNRSAKLAIFLCILNATLQMGVVQVINVYDHAAQLASTRMLLSPSEVLEDGDNAVEDFNKKNADMQRKASADFHREFLPPREKAEIDQLNDIQPLCKRIGKGDGTFTCMPSSVKFAYDWENLDSNKDGVWTMEEAKADLGGLRKKRHISPETIFNNLINGLRMQAAFLQTSGSNKTLYLSPGLQNGRSVTKAYFNYWKGDAMMCGMFDANSCEAAAKQGVFKSALVPGRISPQMKGITDLDSAIQYCYRMLQGGGGCETLLPTDFKQNREQRWGRCGARYLVEGGKYVNPYDPTQNVHVLEAGYAGVSAYQRATSRLFLFFLSLVIMLWLLSLIDEWRELVKMAEFLVTYENVMPRQKGGEVIEAEHETVYKNTGITRVHRAILTIVFVVRIMVALVLSQFGTRFLLAETDYLNLVMNSLALTFILTIDTMLFELVENDVKEMLDHCKPLEFQTRLPTSGWMGYLLKKECWGLIMVPILSVTIVLHQNYQSKEPILTVLRCACTQEGAKCLDSSQYLAGWWEDYWGKTLPAAIHQIEALRIADGALGF